MEIFVSIADQTFTLDVEPTDTIQRIKEMVAERLAARLHQPVPPANIRLALSSKPLGEGVGGGSATVADHNLQRHQTLKGTLAEAEAAEEYVPHVKGALARDLAALAKQPKAFMFIGLASYDNGHPEREDDTVSRQQCPTPLPELCQTHGLSLHLLLIDLGFGEPGVSPQIYDVDKGWHAAEVGEKGEGGGPLAGVRVRRYRHENGALLTCYPTNIAGREYRLANLEATDLATEPPERTLAGLDLRQIAAAVASNGGTLVAGNFFTTAAPTTSTATARSSPPWARRTTWAPDGRGLIRWTDVGRRRRPISANGGRSGR